MTRKPSLSVPSVALMPLQTRTATLSTAEPKVKPDPVEVVVVAAVVPVAVEGWVGVLEGSVEVGHVGEEGRQVVEEAEGERVEAEGVPEEDMEILKNNAQNIKLLYL